jgi:hypothetical protein
MKNILTEDIKKLVKIAIDEKLGVPNNISTVAESIYHELYKKFEIFKSQVITHDTIDLLLTGDFTVGDIHFTKVFVKTQFIFSYEINDKIIINRMGFSYDSIMMFDDKKPLSTPLIPKGMLNLVLTLTIPAHEDVTFNQVLKLMSSGKSTITMGLSHEIAHFYERSKTKSSSIGHKIEYEENRFDTDVVPFDQLMRAMYYTSNIETIVRPSEMAYLMKDKNITKSQFKNFLGQYGMYIILQKLKKMTYDNFINQLWRESESIKKYLRSNGAHSSIFTKTDEDIVNYFLSFKLNQMNQVKLSKYMGIIQKNPEAYEKYHGHYLNYSKSQSKPEEYEKYFRKIISVINYKSGVTIKKLHKLYDLALDG